MLVEESLLDFHDRQILKAMHEFEFGPLGERFPASWSRVSPVPVYLVDAATVRLADQILDGHDSSINRGDVHPRLEAMRGLGLVCEGDRHWPEFTDRGMSDGRFIAVDSKRGQGKRLIAFGNPRVRVPHRYRDYQIYVGLQSKREAALIEAGYYDSENETSAIWSSVIQKSLYLTWRYYDPALEMQWYQLSGIPYKERIPHQGLCYALTKHGIALARRFGHTREM